MTLEELIEDLDNLREWCENDMLTDEDDTNISSLCDTALSVLKNCIEIPENATNGDTLKRIFPNITIYEIYNCSTGELFGYRVVGIGGCIREYTLEWWNAPYEIAVAK